MTTLPYLDYKNEAFELKLNRQLSDLNPVIVGIAKCKPGDIGLEELSPFTLIHYVYAGKGTYVFRGNRYSIEAGQAFITPPNEAARAIADEHDPWISAWVGFKGSLAPDFWRLPPVFTPDEPCFPHIRNLQEPQPNLEIELAIDLMTLYTKLIFPTSGKRERAPSYVQAVIDYISVHYMEDLSIQDVADHVGLNRDYLSRVFKAEMNSSIQSHLLYVRMMEAKRLLSLGRSVDEAGKLCGFNSLAHFSRQFKRYIGRSPQQWVQYLREQQGMS